MNYGLGINEEWRADEMGRVKAVFNRGTFGRYATIEEWINETMIFTGDALKLVGRLRQQQERKAK